MARQSKTAFAKRVEKAQPGVRCVWFPTLNSFGIWEAGLSAAQRDATTIYQADEDGAAFAARKLWEHLHHTSQCASCGTAVCPGAEETHCYRGYAIRRNRENTAIVAVHVESGSLLAGTFDNSIEAKTAVDTYLGSEEKLPVRYAGACSMTVKLIWHDPYVGKGGIVRTIANVRRIEPPDSVHPASWWLVMESDTPVAVSKRYQLLISAE